MTAIVYLSNAGSAKRYAEMLSNKLGYPLFDLKDKDSVPKDSKIIFIGWVMAGTIQGLKEVREALGTPKAVVAVGMMVGDKQSEDIKEKNAITEPFFFLPGAFNMKNLSGMYKMMMGMMVKMIKGKLKESGDPKAKEIVDKFEEGFDMVDEKNLDGIIEFLKDEGI